MTSSQHRSTSTARRAGRWVATGAMVVVTLFCLAWMAPAALGYDRYVITGPSMTHTYDKGSVVLEKMVPVEELEVGDVITYTPPADSGVTWLVTHRIVKIQPAKGGGLLFTTKGDHNPDPDPWKFQLTDPQQPVVVAGVPKAGWVFIALADRTTRMVLIGVPAALVALGALGQLLSAVREGTRSRRESRSESLAVVTADVPARAPQLV